MAKWTKEHKKARARELYKEGMKVVRIAERLGISRFSVMRALKEKEGRRINGEKKHE